jgi:hypothetical protein
VSSPRKGTLTYVERREDWREQFFHRFQFQSKYFVLTEDVVEHSPNPFAILREYLHVDLRGFLDRNGYTTSELPKTCSDTDIHTDEDSQGQDLHTQPITKAC